MREEPLVSVVIPALNAERTIRTTLDSIRNQTYRNVEVVIVDRASTDNTVAVARGSYPGIRVIQGGAERSSQKNKGAALARGDYLYFVDSDVIVERGVISEAIELCEAGCQAAIIHNTSDPRAGYWAKVRKLEKDCYFRDPAHVASRFVRADLFRKIGGFDEELVAGEDYELHNRLLMAGAKMGWCGNREYHFGEPRRLKEIIVKHIYYGKYILNYARKQLSYTLIQLSPLRATYIRNLPLFLNQPKLIPGFVVYQYVRYASAIAGLLSALFWPPPVGIQLPATVPPPIRASDPVKRVSIVLVTRNRPQEFKRCVESLRPDISGGAELVVVDDCSKESYASAALPPNAKAIRNGSRLFLNASRNLGAAISSREYILFVDDDNVAAVGTVAKLAETLDSFSTIGVAAPVAITPDARVWYAGGWVSPLSGLTVHQYRGDRQVALPKRLIETRLFHNCFMVRREAFASIGGFDSVRFPMYLAEQDASEKLYRRGYKVVVDPLAIVTHNIESGGVRSLLRNVHITEPARAYFVGRNRILFMKTYRGRMQYLLFLTVFQPVITIIHLLSIISSRNGKVRWTQLAGPYVRGVFDGISGRVRLGRGLLEHLRLGT